MHIHNTDETDYSIHLKLQLIELSLLQKVEHHDYFGFGAFPKSYRLSGLGASQKASCLRVVI